MCPPLDWYPQPAQTGSSLAEQADVTVQAAAQKPGAKFYSGEEDSFGERGNHNWSDAVKAIVGINQASTPRALKRADETLRQRDRTRRGQNRNATRLARRTHAGGHARSSKAVDGAQFKHRRGEEPCWSTTRDEPDWRAAQSPETVKGDRPRRPASCSACGPCVFPQRQWRKMARRRSRSRPASHFQARSTENRSLKRNSQCNY